MDVMDENGQSGVIKAVEAVVMLKTAFSGPVMQ